jgi:AraC-like DNA-binding protein
MMGESLVMANRGDLRLGTDSGGLSAHARTGPLFRALENKIQDSGLTVAAVCRRAGVSEGYFYDARTGRHGVSRWWVRRCELAIEALLGGDPSDAEPSDLHLTTIYRGFLAEACRHYGVELAEAGRAAQGPAVKARHLALYLVNTELAVRPATLARLFGVTRSAMTQALQAVEDRREDRGFDQAVTAMAARITGRT